MLETAIIKQKRLIEAGFLFSFNEAAIISELWMIFGYNKTKTLCLNNKPYWLTSYSKLVARLPMCRKGIAQMRREIKYFAELDIICLHPDNAKLAKLWIGKGKNWDLCFEDSADTPPETPVTHEQGRDSTPVTHEQATLFTHEQGQDVDSFLVERNIKKVESSRKKEWCQKQASNFCKNSDALNNQNCETLVAFVLWHGVTLEQLPGMFAMINEARAYEAWKRLKEVNWKAFRNKGAGLNWWFRENYPPELF